MVILQEDADGKGYTIMVATALQGAVVFYIVIPFRDVFWKPGSEVYLKFVRRKMNVDKIIEKCRISCGCDYEVDRIVVKS